MGRTRPALRPTPRSRTRREPELARPVRLRRPRGREADREARGALRPGDRAEEADRRAAARLPREHEPAIEDVAAVRLAVARVQGQRDGPGDEGAHLPRTVLVDGAGCRRRRDERVPDVDPRQGRRDDRAQQVELELPEREPLREVEAGSELVAAERRVSRAATVAGVNGDLFSASGEPAGIVLRGGLLDHAPNAGRSSIGLDAGGPPPGAGLRDDRHWRREAGLPRQRGLLARAARAAPPAHSGRPARRREDRPRRDRRGLRRLQRRRDELRALPHPRPPRRCHGGGAREWDGDDDGLRRDAPRPSVGAGRGAADLGRAARLVLGRLRPAAAGRGPLAERRRGRRTADAQLQGRPPPDRDRNARRPRRRHPRRRQRRPRPRHVPVRLEWDEPRRLAGARGSVALLRQRRRRPRPPLERRAHVRRRRDARVPPRPGDGHRPARRLVAPRLLRPRPPGAGDGRGRAAGGRRRADALPAPARRGDGPGRLERARRPPQPRLPGPLRAPRDRHERARCRLARGAVPRAPRVTSARAARERLEFADDARRRPRPLRRLRAHGDRRRLPGGERAGDGLRGRPGGRRLRRPARLAVRLARPLRRRCVPGDGPRRRSRLSPRRDRGMGDRLLRRQAVPRLGAQAREGAALVRPLGGLGGPARPRHARRALVRLDPGRDLPHAVRALHGADGDRLHRLVLRLRGRRLGARAELGALPPRLPLRRLRDRRGGRPRRRLAAPALALGAPRPVGCRVDWLAGAGDPALQPCRAIRPAPSRAEEAAPRPPRRGPLHPPLPGARLRGGGRGLPRRPAHDWRGERHRRDRDRPRRARDRGRRRGDLPRLHLLRHRRADRQARRDAGLCRRRSRDAEPRPGRRGPTDHAEDEGDHARPPLRPAGAARRARRARRDDRRGRGAGLRRRGHRHDRDRVDLLVLSHEEPRRPRRRRSDRGDRRGARRADPTASLPRFARQEGLLPRRLQLAPRRAPGGGAPPHAAPRRRVEPAPPRGGRALRRARARRPRRAPAGRRPARLPPVRRPLAGTRPRPRGPRRGGDRLRVVLRDAAPPPARASLPRPLGGRLSRDRARPAREPRAAAVAGGRAGGSAADRRHRPLGRPRARRLVIPITRHRLWQLAADGVLVALAWWLAFQLRWDNGVPPPYHRLFNRSILVVVAITLVVFVLSGFYRRWWRYVSTRDMWGAARGVAIGCLISDLTVYFMHPVRGFPLPRGVAVLDFLLLLAFVAGSRLLARTITERPAPGRLVVRGKEVIVVGAGDAAWQVVRQMLRTPELGYTPIGLIDDDPKKRHIQLEGVRVIGTTGELPQVLRDNPPDEILIAIPSAPGELRERVVEAARQARVPVKTVPGLHELISGRVSVSQIRPVQVEDLLGREAVEVDMDAIASYLKDEVVLVTGAGGSIGAELCRQIVRAGPNRLVLVDHGETPLFEIERELVDERGFHAVGPVLGDVKSEPKMRQLFETYRPAVVFHAAAYKHVPMMEANPLESVRNNVLATKLVADVAVEYGAERFVLVSTDKALNPAAVYGQSKAICEWIVEAYGARRDVSTRFVAVRFGNVLGSAGSVITI